MFLDYAKQKAVSMNLSKYKEEILNYYSRNWHI